jgi:hypothetical protein
MAKQTWTLKGRILFKPQFTETKEEYGDIVALPGVRVKVSAKESKLDPTWDEWADVCVGPQGRFSATNEKDKTPRYFRVRVMYKDDHLKIYPPNDGILKKLTMAATGVTVATELAEEALELALSQTTRLTYDVDWYDVVRDDDKSERRGPGVVDFGDLVFQSGGRLDLGDRVARRHADIWWLAKKMMSVLDGVRSGFPDKQPVAISHPFENPLISDRVESSYTNPKTGIVTLIENSRSDHFNAPSLAHELMHAHMYQHSKGELGLAWQLLVHGSTHDGRQAKTWVAFHEGFAEWAGNMLYTEIYNRPATIYGDKDERTGVTLDNRAAPFSRRFLRDVGIESLSDLDHYEYGWIALFTSIVSSSLDNLDPDTSETWAHFPGSRTWYAGPIETRGSAIGMSEVLRAFDPAPDKGYPDVITTKEMTRVAFWKRLLAISDVVTEEVRDRIDELLDTGEKKKPGIPVKTQKPKPRLKAKARGR